MIVAVRRVVLAAALGAAASTLTLPTLAQQQPGDATTLHLAELDAATQLQLQTMQNAIRYLQIQAQQITQIKEALAQAQQSDKERAALIEQRFNKVDSALASSRLLELVSQVETLNTELNRLRGEVETLRNAFATAEKREREHYSELEARLKRAEQAASVRASNAAPEPSGISPFMETVPNEPTASGADTKNSDATAAAADLQQSSGATAAAPAAEAAGSNVPVLIAVAPQPAASVPAATPATGSNVTVVTASVAKPAARDPAAENKLYDEALRQFRAGNYTGAIASFQNFTEKFPASGLAPNAQYWTGVSYFNQRDFAKAMQTNQALVKQYPESSKVPDAMLNMASIHVEQNDHAAARGVLDEIISKFPNSDAAAKARTRLTLLRK